MSEAVGEVDSSSDTARAFVERLFVLMRTISMHGADHPAVQQAAAHMVFTVQTAAPPFAVQFIHQGVFRDRVLVPLDPESFHRSQQVARALANLGAQEIAVDEPLDAESLVRLGALAARGAHGPVEHADRIHVPGVRLREIPDAQWGVEGEHVTPEVFVLVQVSLAIGDAETLMNQSLEPWNWGAGISTLRRVERALDTSGTASARTIETVPGAWSVPRRAIAAVLHSAQILRDLGVTPGLRRVINHALLAICLHGLRARGGLPLREAVSATIVRMLDAPMLTRSGIDPHRFKVSAMLDRFERFAEEPAAWLPAMHLVAMMYALERARCPEGAGFDLAQVDLLAQASAASGRGFDPVWTRALVRSAGVVPPGAVVQLADGRVGVVMEPGSAGDPLRPKVLVDGALVEPARRVRVVSGAIMAAAAQ